MTVSGTAGHSAAAVLYALDLQRMAAFYTALTGLTVTYSDDAYVVLESPGLQLTIVRIPTAVAASVTLSDPPVRRVDTPIKLAFFVDSIEAARERIGAWGER